MQPAAAAAALRRDGDRRQYSFFIRLFCIIRHTFSFTESHMKQCFLLLFVGLLFAGSAQAQLSFNRADIEGELQDRTLTIFQTEQLSGVTFNLGAAGSGQVYDFTGLTFTQGTYQTTFIQPDATPYAMDYPTATHSMIVGTTDLAFTYSRLDDNGYYDLGFATEVSGTPYILKYDPEMPSFKFPLQLGSSWKYTGNEIAPIEGFYQITESQVDVVSEGIMMTDQGSWSAICIRTIEKTTDRIEFGGMVISEDVMRSANYTFLTKDGVSASISVDTTDAASWTPHISEASLTFTALPSSITPTSSANAFGIVSVYPHPVAGGNVTVTWESGMAAVLTLHDNCGRELRRLNTEAAPGLLQQTHITVQDLPAGMYFLRLSQGNAAAQKPVLILR